MNKSELKTFATYARRELLEKVALRAKGLGMDKKNNISIISNGEQLIVNGTQYPSTMRNAFESLKRQYELKGYEQLMEEEAYTWFNRIIAIRYMEIHGYLPERINVLSSSTGKVEPDILLQYQSMELNVDKLRIRDMIDAGKSEEAYRELFIAQCNTLQSFLPFLFEKIDDFTALLLPNYLLDNESIINKLVRNGELTSCFMEVEVIGWLYQYYMSERKEQVGGLRNNSISKEDLPVVTQLFTPRWIVEYMVQNSLGKLYNSMQPDNGLVNNWNYFLETSENIPIPNCASLEEIKIFDPACGSGHILVYAFDLLYDMYIEAGYFEQEIPSLIIEKNLHGLDIDMRAIQLANFALYMKAQEKNRRFLRCSKDIRVGLYEFIDSVSVSEEAIDLIVSKQISRDFIRETLSLFKNAKQFGSLIQVNYQPEAYKKVVELILSLDTEYLDLYEQSLVKELIGNMLPIFQQAYLLSLKYEVVITNPPYHNKYNIILKGFMETNYKKYKTDLYSAFIYRCITFTAKNGFSAMMTPFTWMFISSHEKLRHFIIESYTISSLIQLEYSAFKEATVPICTFVIHNQDDSTFGEYIRLSEIKGDQAIGVKRAVLDQVDYRFTLNTKDLLDLPGYPIAYWSSQKVRNVFKNFMKLGDVATSRVGLQTGENQKFIRFWHEVKANEISFNYPSDKTINSDKKWVPYPKGGEYRKWYGNLEHVLLWFNDGYDIKTDKKQKLEAGLIEKKNSECWNQEYYFLEHISWSNISSGTFSLRFINQGAIFSNATSAIFEPANELFFIMAILNSSVSANLQKLISPTINNLPGYVMKLPYYSTSDKDHVNKLVKSCIDISKNDWDSLETSWDFKIHPLIKHKGEEVLVQGAFEKWELVNKSWFDKLKENEKELNQEIIKLFDLQNEVTPDVDDKEITIRRANRLREVKTFLSFFIGCLMGRFSLDIEKITYAGGAWNEDNYTKFISNRFDVLLLTDESYFEYDIIFKLKDFLGITFSSKTVEENFQWIAESLELKKNETAEERIRRYFLDEFYKDHCQLYQNRPFYWLVDSGKKKGLRSLIYMHRYQPDTMATIRFEHLQAIQAKYLNEITTIDLRLTNPSLSATEKRAIEKKKEDFQQRIEELTEFDKVLAVYANAQIQIDLDNGVKVNYEKFKGVLAKIK